MLKRLRISNYALIDNVEISFENGMTSITGETGAGKSILLGGLSPVSYTHLTLPTTSSV